MGYTVPTGKERYACENSIPKWEEDALARLGRSSWDEAQHANHEIAKWLVREKSLNNAIEEIMTTRTLKRLEPDAARVFGASLAIAWQKYHKAFGDVPHGSLDQMAALVELAGGEKVLLRVAEYARAQRKGAKRKGRR